MSSPENNEHLPPWLRNVPLPPRPAEAAPPAPEAPPLAGPGEARLPPWLSDLASDQPSVAPEPEGQAALPAWLAEMGEPKPRADDQNVAPLPAWLAEAAGPEPEARETPASPAWLHDPEREPSATPLPAPSEAAPAAPTDLALEATALPAWLREIPSEEIQQPMEAADSGAESGPGGTPDWLTAAAQDEEDAAPAWLRGLTSEPEGDVLPQAEPDAPEWLRDLSAATGGTGPEPPPTPPAGEAPPWLADTPAEAEAATGEIPAGPADELPDWLRGEPATAAPPGEPADLPDWLRGEPAAASSGAAADLPDWLKLPGDAAPAGDLPPWLRDEAGAPVPTGGAPGDAGLPEWLRGASVVPESVTPAQEAPAAPAEPAPAAPAPEVLGAAAAFATAPAGAGAPPPPADTRETKSAFLGESDLPEWLRRTEPEAAPDGGGVTTRELDWLKRLAPADDESVAAAPGVTITRLPPRTAPQRTEAQLSAVALLARLAAEPFPDEAPRPAPAPPSVWQRIGLERVLYLLLLLALVIGLAAPGLNAPLRVPPAAPSARPLFDQLAGLGARDVVLLGYDWDPRRVSELRPLEDAVLGPLIRQRVKFVIVSTLPQGALLAYDLRDRLRAAGYSEGGIDYLLLGYKPGGELALRALAQDFRGVLASDFQGEDATQSALAAGLNTGRPLTALHDLSAIIVLADEPSTVQGWMEQVHRGGLRAGNADVPPITLLLPEEVNPVVQPYTTLPGVTSLAGRQGALAYAALGAAQPRETVAFQSSLQRLGILAFVVLALLGGVVIAIADAARSRRRRA